MKNYKNFLSVLCVVSMIMAMAAPAFAATAEDNTIRSMAYMDTKVATPELRAEIIAARREIIYGNDISWTVNGAVSILHEDGTMTQLPEFSDLFPGWDLKEISNRAPDTSYSGEPSLRANKVYYNKTYPLPVSDQVNNTDNFYTFNANGVMVYACPLTLSAGITIANIGFSNIDTNEDLGWTTGLEKKDVTAINTDEGVRYGVRASSGHLDKSGSACLAVGEDSEISKWIPIIN